MRRASSTIRHRRQRAPLRATVAAALFAPSLALLAALAGCAASPSPQPGGLAAFWPTSLDVSAPLGDPAARPAAALLRPSNDRDWSPEQAVMPRAEFHADSVTIRDVRNFRHTGDGQWDARWYDRTYRLDQIRSVDFIVVPFAASPEMAHTMLSFGFEGDQYVAISVEARREKGETYDSILGLLDRYELIYIVGDERDLIQLRTNIWLNDVYVYRTQASPEQARKLFVDVMRRVNQLAAEPEFYNTLTNNCTTNIVDHVNRLVPGRIPLDRRILLNGRSDQLAFESGLLVVDGSFDDLKARSRVNYAAYRYRDDPNFSALIRNWGRGRDLCNPPPTCHPIAHTGREAPARSTRDSPCPRIAPRV